MTVRYSMLVDVKGDGQGKTKDEARANAMRAYEKELAERMREGEKFLDERHGDYREGPEERNRRYLYKVDDNGVYHYRIVGEVTAVRIRYRYT